MFKVNNKDNKVNNKANSIVLVSLLLTLKIFHTFEHISRPGLSSFIKIIVDGI